MSKTLSMLYAVIMIMVAGCATSSTTNGVVKRADQDLRGGISALGPTDPYLVQIIVDFDWLTNADVYWSPLNVLKVVRKGVAIQDIGEGYMKLVSLDLRVVQKMTNSFAAEIHIAQSDPASGGIDFRYFAIIESEDSLVAEKTNYPKSMLALVSYKWSKDRWVEEHRHPLVPSGK